ncbi:hypothetical protein KXV92_008830 [Aspergillus fumigatus]|nr:hypothetical protein KXX57_008930 [Aspergillus fumigatus]KAH1986529.1 hypothetical protein KXW88_007420 [Aspergillus fumigatus]KAH2304786.1 hypothetical protein KXV47_008925 [Aspergillus fumigatus]KAH3143989.1 hypothetical protein KXW18_008916 [Aspergillus fumigatus]KAH3202478.1 hypothetical protein KXV92_008830 [Aspergillus fumigatus]
MAPPTHRRFLENVEKMPVAGERISFAAAASTSQCRQGRFGPVRLGVACASVTGPGTCTVAVPYW